MASYVTTAHELFFMFSKTIIICFIPLSLGLPLNQPFEFFILLCILAFYFSCEMRQCSKYGVVGIGVICACLAHLVVPKLSIEEGHCLLIENNLIVNENIILKSSLKDLPFAFSADAFFDKPRFSRIVSAINIHDLPSARLGVLNETRFDFYHLPNPFVREALPFLLVYQFPKEAVGMNLTWKGVGWFPLASGEVTRIEEKLLKTTPISSDWVDQPVYFFGGDLYQGTFPGVNTLKIHLNFNSVYTLYDILKKTLLVCSTFLIFFGFFSPISFRRLLWGIGLVGGQVICLLFCYPRFLTTIFPLASGDDGLTYVSMARQMTKNLFHHEWVEAFKGCESIFYYMPGLRYIRTFEMIIFGDMPYGYALFFCALPFIFWCFFSKLWGRHVAFWLYIFFMIPTINPRVCLSNFSFLEYMVKGFGETIAYSLLIAGMGCWITSVNNWKPSHPWSGGFLLFLAIAHRPNLALVVVFFTICMLISRYQEKDFKNAIWMVLGISCTTSIPLHNIFYGRAFIPLTLAASIPENLPVPPSMYIAACKAILIGQLPDHSLVVQQVVTHLKTLFGLKYFWRPLMVGLSALYTLRSRSIFGVFGGIATMLHIQNLFFRPWNRYVDIAYFFSFLCLIYYLLNKFFRKQKLYV